MKSILVILGFLVIALPGRAAFADGTLDVGVIVDDPLQFSAKKWLSGTTAIDGAFYLQDGIDGIEDNTLENYTVHVDYLMHNFSLFDIKQGSLPVHYGVGVKHEEYQESTTSLRVPVGLSYHFKQMPVSVFYEYAFLYDLTGDDASVESEAVFGVRYSF